MSTLFLLFTLACGGGSTTPAPSPAATPENTEAPAPVEAAPVEPAPVEPAPVEPASIQPSTKPDAPSTPTGGPSAAHAAADGAACLAGGDCASGVCEGTGCGADQPGTCKPVNRGCTRDMSPMCTCAGITITGSSSCPGQRIAHRGACPGDAGPMQ